MPADALRRFTPTPLEAIFALDGAAVSLATNCQVLVDRFNAFASPVRDPIGCPVFVWRIVVEPDDKLKTESLIGHYLSHDGLALITFGRRNFLACDMQAHEGVSFVSKRFVRNERLFQQYFLPALTSLLKESLDVPL